MQRLKALEDENRRLKQIVAEQTFDVQALQAVVAKKVSTTARREAVEWHQQTRSTSLRLACRVVGLSTATLRYRPGLNEANAALVEALHTYAAARSRFDDQTLAPIGAECYHGHVN